MKKYLIIILLFYSCNEHSDRNFEPVKPSNKAQPYGISEFLKDNFVPNCFKEMFIEKLDPNSNDSCAFALIDSVQSSDIIRQPLYFLTLTRTFEKADASYSEAVCNFSMEYVKNNTVEFLHQFLSNSELTKSDMELWSNKVMMELIDFADEDADKEVQNYIDNLKKKSMNFDVREKYKLEEFITMMNNYCP